MGFASRRILTFCLFFRSFFYGSTYVSLDVLRVLSPGQARPCLPGLRSCSLMTGVFLSVFCLSVLDVLCLGMCVGFVFAPIGLGLSGVRWVVFPGF